MIFLSHLIFETKKPLCDWLEQYWFGRLGPTFPVGRGQDHRSQLTPFNQVPDFHVEIDTKERDALYQGWELIKTNIQNL